MRMASMTTFNKPKLGKIIKHINLEPHTELLNTVCPVCVVQSTTTFMRIEERD